MEQENKEVAVAENALQKVESTMKTPEEKPTDLVERSVADLVKASVESLKEDFAHQQKIHKEMESKMSELDAPTLMTHDQNTSMAINDKLNRLLTPTFQMIASRQENEMKVKAAAAAGSQAPGLSMQSIQNLNIPPAVLQSLVDNSFDRGN